MRRNRVASVSQPCSAYTCMSTHAPTPPLTRILSLRQVIEITGLSPATIWRMRRRGEMPEPIRLSPGRVGWRESDIERWLVARAEIR